MLPTLSEIRSINFTNSVFLQYGYEPGYASYHFNHPFQSSWIDYHSVNQFSNTENSLIYPDTWKMDNNQPYPNKIFFKKIQTSSLYKVSSYKHRPFLKAEINFQKCCNSTVDGGVMLRKFYLTIVSGCFLNGYVNDFDVNLEPIEYEDELSWRFDHMWAGMKYVREECYPTENLVFIEDTKRDQLWLSALEEN